MTTYEPWNPQSPPMTDPEYFEWVRQRAAEQAALKPWTLVRLLEPHPLVATRRTWWTRVVTWWHNRRRLGERRRAHRMLAARLVELGALKAAGLPLDDGSRQ